MFACNHLAGWLVGLFAVRRMRKFQLTSLVVMGSLILGSVRMQSFVDEG